MDGTALATLIGQYGFPIVAFFVLFKYMGKQEERHKEEMDKMSTAINNNTDIMRQVLTQLKREDDRYDV